jgi:DNA-directed RNA polymerase specialized sigma24 family protein
MADVRCVDVVRHGGDLGLAPEHAQERLAAHLANCLDCAAYVSQITTTRELLRRRRGRGDIQIAVPDDAVPSQEGISTADIDTLRNALLTRARLLDPSNAEDLAQRSLEVGLALQRRDHRPRGIAELTKIMDRLSDAQTRFDGHAAPAVDVTAAARTRADSLEDLDSDADEPGLFYPDLYPGDDELDGWAESPNQWRGGAHIPGPEEVDETGEVYNVLDKALGELPEPLGQLLALVDLQGYTLHDSAQAFGLDNLSATAVLARARNHVRGRLNEYLTGIEAAAHAARG